MQGSNLSMFNYILFLLSADLFRVTSPENVINTEIMAVAISRYPQEEEEKKSTGTGNSR